jgi:hypothetical protein
VVASPENLTRLVVVIRGQRQDPVRAGWDELVVDVLRSEPVPGYYDLLTPTVGTTLTIAVPQALLPVGPLPGSELECRARRGGPDAVLCERDPAPADFVLR